MAKCGCPVSDDAVRTWFHGEVVPRSAQKVAILRVFFREATGQGDTEADTAFQQMEAAWGQAQDRPHAPLRRETAEPDAAWIGAGTPFRTAGLASLTLDEPQQGNEPDAPWFVRARLRLETAEHERREGPSVFIALRNAFLTVAASGYRAVNGSLIGERTPHPNFRPKGDGVEVVGPHEDGLCLDGDPLGEDHIAQIKPAEDNKGEESVTVALHAFRRSFAVSFSPAPPDSDTSDVAANEKDAVLNALIAKGRPKDSQGRTLLARDTMKRKKPE